MNNLELLFKEYSDSIYRFCLFRTNNIEDAEDITASIFQRLIESNSKIISNPRAWLYVAARNALKNYYRDSKNTSDFSEDTISDLNENLESTTLNEQTLKVIEEDLRGIDPLKSEVILLKLWEDMTFDEIAEVTNQSTDSAKKRYYRGISELQLLQKQKEVSRKYSVLSVPILLGGILQLSKVHAYTFSEAVKANILSIITAKAAMKVGFLATTGGKIISLLGATVLVAGSGLGFVLYQNQNKQDLMKDNSNSEIVVDQQDDSCAKVRYTNDNYPDFSFEYDPCEWDVRETLVADLNSSTEIILENELSKESLIFAIEHVAIFTGYGYTCHDSEYIEVNELIARATLSDEIVFGDKEVYLQYVPIGDPWSNGSRKLNSGNLEVNCSAGEGEFVIRTNIKITEEIRESSIFENYPNSDQNFNGFLKVYTSSNSIGSTNDFDEIMKTMTWKPEQFAQTQNSCAKVRYTNDNYPDFSFEYDPCEWEIEEKENLISLISQDQTLNFRKVVGPSNFAPSTGNFYTCSKLNIENVAGSIYRYKLDPNSDYTYEFEGQNYKIFLEGDDVCGEASPIVRTSIKGSDQILYVSVGLVNNGNKESIKLADEIVKSLTWTPEQFTKSTEHKNNIGHFQSKYFSDLAFDYNADYWTVSDNQIDGEFNTSKFINGNIVFTNNSNESVIFKLNAFGGFGFTAESYCNKYPLLLEAKESVNIGLIDLSDYTYPSDLAYTFVIRFYYPDSPEGKEAMIQDAQRENPYRIPGDPVKSLAVEDPTFCKGLENFVYRSNLTDESYHDTFLPGKFKILSDVNISNTEFYNEAFKLLDNFYKQTPTAENNIGL